MEEPCKEVILSGSVEMDLIKPGLDRFIHTLTEFLFSAEATARIFPFLLLQEGKVSKHIGVLYVML